MDEHGNINEDSRKGGSKIKDIKWLLRKGLIIDLVFESFTSLLIQILNTVSKGADSFV